MIGLHMLSALGSGGGHAPAGSAGAGASGKALSQKQLHKLQQQALYEQQQQQQQANIVRISAKTAQPLAVSSVPKCRQTKGLRSHPLDTINGTNSGRPLMSEQVRPAVSGRAASSGGTGGRRALSMDQLEPSGLAGGGGAGGERVLLILNDDHIRGGGVPVIGRRLPAKSMAARSSRVQAGYSGGPSLEAAAVAAAATTKSEYASAISSCEPPAIRLDQVAALGSVQGRRSHRLLLLAGQAGQASRQQQYEFHDAKQQVREEQLRQQQQQQQPIKLQSLAPSQRQQQQMLGQHGQLLSGRRKVKAAAKGLAGSSALESQAHLRPAAFALESQVEGARKSVAKQQRPPRQVSAGSRSGRRIVADPAALLQTAAGLVGTSSCSSLCEFQQQQQQQCWEANCCCWPSGDEAAAATISNNNNSNHYSCPKACCRRAPSSCSSGVAGGEGGCNLARSVSCQRLTFPPCCAPTARCQHHRHRDDSSHSRHQRHHMQPHQSCQANGSSCQANELAGSRHLNQQQQQQHQQQQALRLLGARNANPLPVAPKPIVHYQRPPASASGSTLVLASQSADEQLADEDPVAQMYESLAAELKAKLGDPKFGPILLPPKDYDTMSRKQGKLSGIELRRSTNPQLVGPAAKLNCSAQRNSTSSGPLISAKSACQFEVAPSSQQQQQRRGEPAADTASRQAASCSASSGCCCCSGGSARSSCRSSSDGQSQSTGADESAAAAADCLQRSRSNSSSGLGSISVGAGSPNSSPSSKCSSSEDMRAHAAASAAASATTGKPRETDHKMAAASKRCGRLENPLPEASAMRRANKNCSPDNCCAGSSSSSGSGGGGGSDSGHSGSGRLADDKRCNGNQTSVSSNRCFSNEEQRIMLCKATSRSSSGSSFSDDFYNSKNGSNSGRNHNNDNGSRGRGIEGHNPAKVSDGVLWNGRIEIPLKVNSEKNGNTYLATKQIIY